MRFALAGNPFPLSLWPNVLLASMFWVVSAGLFMMPLIVVSLVLWTRLAQRAPVLESSVSSMLLGLFVLGCVIALFTGAISSWENILEPQYHEPFLRSTISIAGDVIVGVLLGLMLPRLLVKALRAGTF